MSDTVQGKCWSCGAELGPHDYGRETLCLNCGKATRVCKNCRWYAPGRPNDCHEPVAEPILYKDQANYCDFFEPTAEVGTTSGVSDDELLDAAEDLFKL